MVLVVLVGESEVIIELHCVEVHVLSPFQQRVRSACSEVLLAALLADVRIFVTSSILCFFWTSFFSRIAINLFCCAYTCTYIMIVQVDVLHIRTIVMTSLAL